MPVLALSILAATGHVTLAPSFAWLGRWDVAVVFGLATLIEIAADKYAGVDNILDSVGIVVRPLAGALLASSLLANMDPLLGLAAGIIVGGGLAGMVHLGKAKLRLASSAFTGGLANPVVSVLEDALAVIATILSIIVPALMALAVVLGVGFLIRFWTRARHPAKA